ncbi:MAG: SDR family oxidoreductase, partial [bacterium]
RSGKIINISSVSAIIPGSGMAAYCTSKAAILQFTRVVALELAPHKICVNAVCPGTTETKMVTDLIGSEVMENWKKKIPMGRFPRAEDHASLIAFLASSASDCITGQFISVDCGQLLNFAQP